MLDHRLNELDIVAVSYKQILVRDELHICTVLLLGVLHTVIQQLAGAEFGIRTLAVSVCLYIEMGRERVYRFETHSVQTDRFLITL